jgi:hypothetical protein
MLQVHAEFHSKSRLHPTPGNPQNSFAYSLLQISGVGQRWPPLAPRNRPEAI